MGVKRGRRLGGGGGGSEEGGAQRVFLLSPKQPHAMACLSRSAFFEDVSSVLMYFNQISFLAIYKDCRYKRKPRPKN